MIIAICSSMRFLKEMAKIEIELKKLGHKVLVPKGLTMVRNGWQVPQTARGRVKGKLKFNFIKEHFDKIKKSEAILVLNYEKDGQKNYIGPNVFLEMGVAFWLGKKIFVLNPIPRNLLWEEIMGMQPIVLNGDLRKLSL